MNFYILITLLLALFTSSSPTNGIEFDYCVADPTLPRGSSGYACKDPAKVTIDDFSYSGLRNPGNSSNVFKFGPNPAFLSTFPALNGMGISMARADIDVGGAVPIHTHRVAELAILIKGRILAGFIDSNNKAFYKTMEEGDMFIFPPALAHFQVNVGKVPAIAYASFPSSNPGFQGVSSSLFKNDLPTEIIQKITLLDPEQIKKLKAGFGGTN
ncbi:auxin-binding protein ABP19b-like [Silene latifolia]|uniref:auxin-binding protein ABP19b-like n=1 Tax=Silene latifolia TaxID=37657 RepID=UPI003D78028B